MSDPVTKWRLWWSRSPVGLIVIVTVFATSAVTSAVSAAGVIRDAYYATLGRDRELIERLHHLATGVQISHFSEVLHSTPTFREHSGTKVEYVYVLPQCFVQAVTDADDAVEMFAVTTRRKDFTPEFQVPGGGPLVKLGSAFNSIAEPGRPTCGEGARRFQYSERLALGNPGLYQTYVFAFNDAGYGDRDARCVRDEDAVNWDDSCALAEADGGDVPKAPQPHLDPASRDRLTVNTFAVMTESACVSTSFGPDLDKVRLLEL